MDGENYWTKTIKNRVQISSEIYFTGNLSDKFPTTSKLGCKAAAFAEATQIFSGRLVSTHRPERPQVLSRSTSIILAVKFAIRRMALKATGLQICSKILRALEFWWSCCFFKAPRF
jgi:hypothetical protein